MQKTAVINVVGLTKELLGEHTPFLTQWASQGNISTIKPALPAVTCTMQSCYLTGQWPSDHGIVGNGWYFREECEVKFWKQSNKLVRSPKIWEVAKKLDPTFTCTNMFWWYNMYSTVDASATPRPIYAADGRKFPDCYTYPSELRQELQDEYGPFPLFDFWGPKTSIRSSKWIAQASKKLEEKKPATLTLMYLPHLDYNLQRRGPYHPDNAIDLKEIDEVCEDLITFFESRGARVIVLSEYGITPVHNAISINRILRQNGYLEIREERGGEILYAGASSAFAVADHQIAHIYVNDKSKLTKIRKLIEKIPGIELVLAENDKALHHLDHPRSGDLIAIADKDSWFTYYYWLEEHKAPDFARTVDIHRKPGYDPVELFVDPKITFPNLKFLMAMAKKKLGFRYLLDVIPLDPSLIKGSHGRYTAPDQGPLIISKQKHIFSNERLQSIDVYNVILAHLGIG
ncbi:MAG: alkaline phosphatase family protein [Candidatus Paracaedimonas acanthamoebae]|uniref:Alkaline phosphatase family protein n=1 Tax=Candidatus Paracaedimonas acanthamoebae TaxID=244581 RepID=A0A8J7TTI6_9PROT|nr:alkaline phosphatase family protein [Candidatus Paracaedimonas acanthamoebae]